MTYTPSPSIFSVTVCDKTDYPPLRALRDGWTFPNTLLESNGYILIYLISSFEVISWS